MAKKEKLFGDPGQVEDNLMLPPDADVFADGKPGKDTILDASAGDDRAKGGAGDDLITYEHLGNVGGTNRYEGGSGIDTLRLEFTEAEWLALNPGLQADLTRLLDFIDEHTNPTGQVTGQWFDFTALDLRIKQFENVELIVGGVELTPADDPVMAVDDEVEVSEDGDVSGDVIANDSVPDLVASISHDDAGITAGVLIFDNSDGTFTYETNGAFEHLAEGEEDTTQSFTYVVTDANGDTDDATAYITVTGVNDAPTLADGGTLAMEDGDPVDVNLAVLGDDVDSDDTGASLTYRIVGDPFEGSASITGTTLTFDPGADFQDLDDNQTRDVVIQVQAEDVHNALSNIADITVTVEGVTDAPKISELLINGGFETGFLGWTRNSSGSGSYQIDDAADNRTPQSGHQHIGGPSEGNFFAVSDQTSSTLAALEQSFSVPLGAISVTLSFDMFVNNWFATTIINPSGLIRSNNQHARVDLLSAGSAVYDTGAGVISNFYIGADNTSGNPIPPFTSYTFDITADVSPGGTYDLRFAQSDTRYFFNHGVDNVSVAVTFAPGDPLVFDLDGDGVELVSYEESTARFDLNLDGTGDITSWFGSDDAVLAYDANGNGTIDDLSELFSQAFGQGAETSLAALATMDTDGDGRISAADSTFDDILLWRDSNSDGVSGAGELMGLAEFGVAAIDLDAEIVDGGNAITALGSFSYDDGSIGEFAQVDFEYTATVNSSTADDSTIVASTVNGALDDTGFFI